MDPGRLLKFGRELQHAGDLQVLLRTVRQEVLDVVGYESVWLCVLEPDLNYARAISMDGRVEAIANAQGMTTFRIEGDPFLVEILHSRAPVVVEDARTDPRTDKRVVKALGNRTIVNLPLAWIDRPLGVLGMGTFGDEGPRPPTPAQLDAATAIANHVAVAVARIRWREERERLEREREALRGRAPDETPSAANADEGGVIIDGPQNVLRHQGRIVPLGRTREVRRLLFALAETSACVPKAKLAASVFGEIYDRERHDTRLRVNVLRLRKLVQNVGLDVVAEAGGYRLVAPRGVLLLRPND